MDRIRSSLRENLGDERCLFVFPSEVVAGFWRRETVLAGYVKAVRPFRFMSWDTFKERAFTVRKEDRPVNSVARNVFAATYLNRNVAERNLLPGFIDPEYADNSPSLQQFIAKNLPALGSAVETGVDETGELRALLDAYTGFLDENGMFEPRYESVSVMEGDIRALLFFPELLEDYGEFEAEFSKNSGVIPVSREGEPPEYERFVFENSRIETKFLLNRIMQILYRREAEPHEIWVTLADDSMGSELETLSRLCGVPLEFKKGKPLSEYMPVRLFEQIRECVESGFGPASLRRLLLNRSLPWRDPAANRALVRFGTENYGLRNYRLDGRLRDRWEEELSKGALSNGERKKLLEHYRSLRNICAGITGAKSFRGLAEGISRLTSTFFLEGGWADEERKIFQLALELLEELDLEASGIAGSSGIRPFPFFMQTLDDRPYVVPTPGEGIPVYDYRVSAGGEPKIHFVAGVNGTSAQVLVRKYPFHSRQRMDRFGLEDLDLTERFADAYLFSGQQVVLTGSVVTPSGAVLVPERLFAREGQVPMPADRSAVEGWSDFFDDEYGMWNWESESLSLVLPVQKKGFTRAQTSIFRTAGGDFTENPLPGELLNRIVPRLLTDDRLTVSSTSVEEFFDCPYRFLLRFGLGLVEPDVGELPVDPRTAGTLFHRVLQNLFERIESESGRFDPSKIGMYRKMLEETVPETFVRYGRTRPKFIEPAWTETMDRALAYVEKLLELEGKFFPGYRIIALEYRSEEVLDSTCAGHPVVLTGRLDRISASNRGHLVMDYKSRCSIRVGDVRGETGYRSLQLPLYIRLAEADGLEVSEACYAGLKDGKYFPILSDTDKKAIPKEEMETIIGEAMELIETMLGRIESGDFTVFRDEGGARCGGCGFRSVCRERYTIRSRSGNEDQ